MFYVQLNIPPSMMLYYHIPGIG